MKMILVIWLALFPYSALGGDVDMDELYNRLINSKSEKLRTAAFKPARLKVEDIKFNDSGKQNMLNGGDSAVLSFRVKNYGGPAAVVKGTAKSDFRHVKVQPEFELGDLEPGESKRIGVIITSDYALQDGTATITVNFSEGNGNPPDPVSVEFRTFKTIPPKFVIAGLNIDDGTYADKDRLAFGNGNGVLEPGESAEITVLVKNEGGAARDVEVALEVEGDEYDLRVLEDENFGEAYELGPLETNDWRELKFGVAVSKVFKAAQKYPFILAISEQRQRFNTKLPLPITVNDATPMAQRVNLVPMDRPKSKISPVPSFGKELLNFPEAASGNKDGVAVIVGVKRYSNSMVPLVDYALKDAAIVKEYVVKALGYQEGNIIYLENPTKADLEKVFGNEANPEGQLFDYIKKGKSDVFVYYTGHGAPDLETKESYLVPSDSDPNYVRLSGYPLKTLYKNLAKLPARDISVAIDACFSGISDKGSIISKASPLLVVPTLPGAGRLNLFSSSRAEEVSSWYPDKQHSLFTYFFLKGLQGAADKNRDRRVSYGELAAYVSENVSYYARRLYGRKQNPTFTGARGGIFMRYR